MGALIFCAFFFLMQTQRHELKVCADAEGYKFTWMDGQMSVPFTAERLNDTAIVCCDNVRFVTSEGVLANGKCIVALDVGGLK